MSPIQFDQGRHALDELSQRHAGLLDRNEATTRLQLIDDLLFSVLGWNREECISEERGGGGITDYSLGMPARRLIVEAKREGIYFELPEGQRGGSIPIRTLLTTPEIESALKQALSYSQERGVPFVAVTNGHQLIAFVGSRQDGVSPLDGIALVFTSLEDMRAQFRLLWDNLSSNAIATQRLFTTLRDTASSPPPEKLAERLARYPRFSIRNRLQTDLQILADLFIEDIVQVGDDEAREEDFLRQCYSTSGALSQYALLSREILRTRYSTLMQNDMGVEVEDANPKEGPEHFREDVLAAALSRRPIVLLGDVGVGKTMFIRHLMRIDAKEIFGEAISLYVDFRAEPALQSDLSAFVYTSIREQLLKNHEVDVEASNFVRAVYHGDLNRFDKSILGQLREVDPTAYSREQIKFLADKVSNRNEHLKKSLDHIANGRKKQVVIFLDNIDQRPIEFQEQVYGIAHAMAESWPAAVFVSLRPSTFFISKRSGSLAAYQPRVFTISPPRIDIVLSRRIEYALKQLEEERTLSSLPEGIGMDVHNLVLYLQALLRTFQDSETIIALIDNLSGGNVRKALDFVQTFIASGNVDSERMLERMRQSSHFTVQVHQFLRALLLGDYQDYQPASSPIANIFDLLSPDGREHFLIPLLIAENERIGGGGADEGYVDAATLYEFAQSIGFNPMQIEWALERAVSNELLEERLATLESPHRMYRVTSVGTYTIRMLPRLFAYLDAVVIDTPIVDPSYRKLIKDVFGIDDRLARAEIFRTYLDGQWNGLEDLPHSFDWVTTSSEAREDIFSIGRRVAGWP